MPEEPNDIRPALGWQSRLQSLFGQVQRVATPGQTVEQKLRDILQQDAASRTAMPNAVQLKSMMDRVMQRVLTRHFSPLAGPFDEQPYSHLAPADRDVQQQAHGRIESKLSAAVISSGIGAKELEAITSTLVQQAAERGQWRVDGPYDDYSWRPSGDGRGASRPRPSSTHA